jgi:3-phosphoshikimate 1-carboxyvinyltransferase
MEEALKALVVKIEKKANTWIVTRKGPFKAPKSALFLGNAGTAVRFLTAMLAHQPFPCTIDGDARMRERPLVDLIEGLQQLGAKIDCPTGCPPLTLLGGPLHGSRVKIHGNNSSQYVSALLMLAPLLPEGLTIEVEGALTSKPYIDMTLAIMNKFCIQKITREAYRWFKIPPQNYQPITHTIESDASSASYFFGLAAITGKTITVENLSRQTGQPDIRVLDALETMGCKVKETLLGIQITGPQKLKPLGSLDANDFPDGAMTLAVVSAFAEGKTELTGLQNLRIKESDRLHALATELQKIGAHVVEKADGLEIHGEPSTLRGASIATYNDHRIAMCFGMAKAQLPNLQIENPKCVNKTYPQFWEDLKIAT